MNLHAIALGTAELGFFAPARAYQLFSGPDAPTGYHPDQWPTRPPEINPSGGDWQILVLTPVEIAIKNQAVLGAVQTLRDGGTDDAQGTRETVLLARARRAEWLLPLIP